MENIQDFIKLHPLHISAHEISCEEHPRYETMKDDKWFRQATHFEVGCAGPDGEFTTYWSTARHEEPTAIEILDSLRSDCMSLFDGEKIVPETLEAFADFCEEFGYLSPANDPRSFGDLRRNKPRNPLREAVGIFRGCREAGENLLKVYGSETLNRLMEVEGL